MSSQTPPTKNSLWPKGLLDLVPFSHHSLCLGRRKTEIRDVEALHFPKDTMAPDYWGILRWALLKVVFPLFFTANESDEGILKMQLFHS